MPAPNRRKVIRFEKHDSLPHYRVTIEGRYVGCLQRYGTRDWRIAGVDGFLHRAETLDAARYIFKSRLTTAATTLGFET